MILNSLNILTALMNHKTTTINIVVNLIHQNVYRKNQQEKSLSLKDRYQARKCKNHHDFSKVSSIRLAN